MCVIGCMTFGSAVGEVFPVWLGHASSGPRPDSFVPTPFAHSTLVFPNVRMHNDGTALKSGCVTVSMRRSSRGCWLYKQNKIRKGKKKKKRSNLDATQNTVRYQWRSNEPLVAAFKVLELDNW